MAMSLPFVLVAPGVPPIPSAADLKHVALDNLKDDEAAMMAKLEPGHVFPEYASRRQISGKMGGKMDALLPRGAVWDGYIKTEKTRAEISHEMTRLDTLITDNVRLLDYPKSTYSDACIAAWEPFNDNRCWCYSGCALDCTHEPEAADGVPGTPGLNIHPSWCGSCRRADWFECGDLTKAIVNDCSQENGAELTPGVDKLFEAYDTMAGVLPYEGNINIQDGTGGTRVLLSTTETGDNVDLHTEDDDSGRQQWSIERIQGFEADTFSIKIKGGVSTNRVYLSTTQDGSTVDLHSEDDNSGRQHWTIDRCQDDGCNWFNIKIRDGTDGDRVFLSVTADGSNVDLNEEDDGSGRQRWQLTDMTASCGEP